jgi:hypothetical protein
MNRTPEFEPERYELYEGPRYHFGLDRRDFLKALSGGILVCLLAGESRGQQPARAEKAGWKGFAVQPTPKGTPALRSNAASRATRPRGLI